LETNPKKCWRLSKLKEVVSSRDHTYYRGLLAQGICFTYKTVASPEATIFTSFNRTEPIDFAKPAATVITSEPDRKGDVISMNTPRSIKTLGFPFFVSYDAIKDQEFQISYNRISTGNFDWGALIYQTLNHERQYHSYAGPIYDEGRLALIEKAAASGFPVMRWSAAHALCEAKFQVEGRYEELLKKLVNDTNRWVSAAAAQSIASETGQRPCSQSTHRYNGKNLNGPFLK